MEPRAVYAHPTPPNQGQTLRAVEEASVLSGLENRLEKLAELNHTHNGQMDAQLDQLLGCAPCGATAGPANNGPSGQLDRIGNLVTQLEIAADRRQELIRRLSRV